MARYSKKRGFWGRAFPILYVLFNVVMLFMLFMLVVARAGAI